MSSNYTGSNQLVKLFLRKLWKKSIRIFFLHIFKVKAFSIANRAGLGSAQFDMCHSEIKWNVSRDWQVNMTKQDEVKFFDFGFDDFFEKWFSVRERANWPTNCASDERAEASLRE